jgi:hypothetical protein
VHLGLLGCRVLDRDGDMPVIRDDFSIQESSGMDVGS